MVVPHGGHAHVLQSPLFPPLTAPLLAAFGPRGAYVWPALAFVALIPLLATARRHLLPDTSWAVLAWIAVTASPLLLYALEFWEHAPAVALLAAGTAMVAPCLAGAGSAARVAAGGALVGAGVLLRPEGAWYAAGLALALGPRWWLPFGGGAAALLLPAAALNYAHFGNPLGAHATAVLAPIGESYVAARWQRVQDWLWPTSAGEAAGLGARGRRVGRGGVPRRRARATAPRAGRHRRRGDARGTAGAALAVVLAGISAGAAGARAGGHVAGGRAAARRGGARDGGGRGAHGHQRRRRAVGHAVSARRGAAAAAAGGARRHRRGRRRRVAPAPARAARRDSAGRRGHQPQRLPRAARRQAQLRGTRDGGGVRGAARRRDRDQRVVARSGRGDAASARGRFSMSRTRRPPAARWP